MANHCFDHSYRIFARRATSVTSAVVMVISKETANLAISFYTFWPIDRIVTRIWVNNHRALTDVVSDLPAITSGIKSSDHTATVGTLPKPNVERNAIRRFFD